MSRGGKELHICLFKRVPLSNTFFIVRLQNSHNDACHKLMKSEIFGCPTSAEGEELHICKIHGDVTSKWVDFTQKFGKGWSHFDPSPKRIPKHGSNG